MSRIFGRHKNAENDGYVMPKLRKLESPSTQAAQLFSIYLTSKGPQDDDLFQTLGGTIMLADITQLDSMKDTSPIVSCSHLHDPKTITLLLL